MKKTIIIFIIILIVIGVAFYLFTTPLGSKTLVKDGPSVISTNMREESRKGYEIIDLRTKNVWLSSDFSVEEFKDLDLPFLWIKNDSVRIGVPDEARFIQSPGCSQEDNYNEKQMFGKNFLNVTKLENLGKYIDDSKLLQKSSLEKHHEITYFSGRTIRLIVNPDGVQYILVSRDFDRTKEYPLLPDGWEYKVIELTQDLTVNLSGIVEVIRTDNNDSFQGPLDEDLNIIQE